MFFQSWDPNGERIQAGVDGAEPVPGGDRLPPHDLGRGGEHALQAPGLRHAPPRHLRTRLHHQGNCIKATYLEVGCNAQEVG